MAIKEQIAWGIEILSISNTIDFSATTKPCENCVVEADSSDANNTSLGSVKVFSFKISSMEVTDYTQIKKACTLVNDE